MKWDWGFLRLVGYWFVGVTAAAVYPLVKYFPPEVMESFFAAGLLSFVNIVIGYLAVEYSFPKSNTMFLKVILGSMLARLIGMGAAVVLLVEVLHFPALALMLSLLLFYGMNLALEVYFLQKKVALRHQQ